MKNNNQKSSYTEPIFRKIFDSLLEGIQIIDFDWHYIYVNDAAARHEKTTKEALLGYTMMDKHPNLENLPLYKALKHCMDNREVQQLEYQFLYPDNSKKWLALSIEPIEEGIFILSSDINARKEMEEKLGKANRLYAFTSSINQSIVHITNELELLNKVCDIALEVGGFKMAWVDLIDKETQQLKIVSIRGAEEVTKEAKKHANLKYTHPIISNSQKVFTSGVYIVSNDLQNDLSMSYWKDKLIYYGIKSGIFLPLKKFGETIGVFGFVSTIQNFFDDQEITLLEEAIKDISFALEVIENTRNHKVADQLALNNEKRFRALIEKSSDMKTLATREGKIIYASPSVTKVLGFSIKEFLQKTFFDIIHPEDLERFTLNRNEIIQTPNAAFYDQCRMQHKNGKWIWCEIILTNLLYEQGIEALVSNFRDISDKKLAEQQREFDQNNLYALINNTNDLMWSVDTDFKLLTFNQPFEKSVEQAIGKTLEKGSSVLSFVPSPAELSYYKQLYERAFSGESFIEINKSENDIWFEISFCPIYKGNEIIGTACHSRNITEIIQAEQQLKEQNAELRKTNAELDRFVYSTSHDLRSPLTSVLGLVYLIQNSTKEQDTLHYIKLIEISINRLDEFIRNILSYSRNNRMDIIVENIPIRKTIEEVINLFRNIKGAEGISFEVEVDEKEPFYSDFQRFSRVLENFISNAIKYHKKDSENRYIKVKAKSKKDQMILSVEDNGIGIAPIHHQKIFDMFFRLSGKIPGSGIGLYLVKEIIEKLEGTVEVKSEEGVGSTFIIKLKNMSLV